MNVVGIDLSTRAVDLVKLSENDNRAEWVRCELHGKTAWERALAVNRALIDGLPAEITEPECDPFTVGNNPCFAPCGKAVCRDHGCERVYRSPLIVTSWWDDVYLVAVETPVNDQKRVLRLIQGAVIASLPVHLRQPHCCWEVHPSTWKAGLGLKGKPTSEDVARFAGEGTVIDLPQVSWVDAQQNFRDAYCLALYARDTNARAVAATLGVTT